MFADRVFETTTTTGTGSYALGGAQADYDGFADAFANGEIVAYHCRNADASVWESGYGVLDTGAGTIERTVLRSSSGTSKINWTSGTKSIYSWPASAVLKAHLSGAKGSARPGWLPAGGTWIKDNVSPWVQYLYDGTDDIPVGEIDPTANTFTAMAGSQKAVGLNETLGSNVASATSTNIWDATGKTVHVTGTTTITGLGTAPQAGARRLVVFDGALTLTNGANLILPGGVDITTAAGDVMEVLAETTTQHRITSYTRASGEAVAGGAPSVALLQYQVASGNNGPTYTASAWRTVLVNTEVSDPDGIVALSSNQFTPSAGSYRLRAFMPIGTAQASGVQSRLRLRNATAGSTVVQGHNSTGQNSSVDMGLLTMESAVFAANGSDAYELQVYPNRDATAVAAVGSGDAEVYAIIIIERVA